MVIKSWNNSEELEALAEKQRNHVVTKPWNHKEELAALMKLVTIGNQVIAITGEQGSGKYRYSEALEKWN